MEGSSVREMRPAISAVVITENAERHIGGCLESIDWCDEIVVIDSGSEDNTLAIARQYSEKVFVEEWKGFGRQKQSAVEKSSHEWVLSVDADEKVPEKLRDEILEKLCHGDDIAGFYIPRKNYFKDKWLRFGGQYPDYVLRLFRKSLGVFTPHIVHERVVVKGRTAKLKTPIEHYTFEDITSRLRKMNEYSSLSAAMARDAGKRARLFSPLSHLVVFFFKDYFLRLGFLDGKEGFHVALLQSLGAYFKYAKLVELQEKEKVTQTFSNPSR